MAKKSTAQKQIETEIKKQMKEAAKHSYLRGVKPESDKEAKGPVKLTGALPVVNGKIAADEKDIANFVKTAKIIKSEKSAQKNPAKKEFLESVQREVTAKKPVSFIQNAPKSGSAVYMPDLKGGEEKGAKALDLKSPAKKESAGSGKKDNFADGKSGINTKTLMFGDVGFFKNDAPQEEERKPPLKLDLKETLSDETLKYPELLKNGYGEYIIKKPRLKPVLTPEVSEHAKRAAGKYATREEIAELNAEIKDKDRYYTETEIRGKKAREALRDKYAENMARLSKQLPGRADAETEKFVDKATEKHPLFGGAGVSAMSVGDRAFGGMAATGDTFTQYFKPNERIDMLDPGSLSMARANAIRKRVAEKIDNGFLSGAYQVGMSIVDSVVNTTVWGGLGAGTASGSMAAAAAADGMLSAESRGADDDQIIATGIATGLAEFIFEKYSIENFLKTRDAVSLRSAVGEAIKGNRKNAALIGKEFLKNTAKQSAIEASEEMFTEIANIITDGIIMGQKSEGALRKLAYESQGYSSGEAQKAVIFDNIEQVVAAGIGGAASGGVMSLVGGLTAPMYNTEKMLEEYNFYKKAAKEGMTFDEIKRAEGGSMVYSDDALKKKAYEAGTKEASPEAAKKAKERESAKKAENVKTVEVHQKNASPFQVINDTDSEGEKRIKREYNLFVTAGRNARDFDAFNKATENDNISIGKKARYEAYEAGFNSRSDVEAFYNGENETQIHSRAKKDGTGLVANEYISQLNKNERELLADMGQRLGKKVYVSESVMDSDGKSVEGKITDEAIYISAAGKDKPIWIATHEFGHQMKTLAPESWKAYREKVVEMAKRSGRYDDTIKKLRKAYGNITEAELTEELACDYAEKLFKDPEELSEAIKKDRSLMEKVKDIWFKILGCFNKNARAESNMREAQRTWQEALRRAEEAAGETTDGEVRYKRAYKEEDGKIYDYTKPFSQQLEDWKAGKIPEYDTLLVGGTPEVMQKIGMNALPITINQRHIDYALNNTKDIDHSLGEALLSQLPEAIKKPVAIISSETKPGRVVALLDITHNKKNVVAPVEIDGYGRQNLLRIDSNAIASVFSKGNAVTGLLKNAVQKEANGQKAVFYLDKNKAAVLLRRAGLQLPGGSFQNNGYIHSIREEGTNVNTRFKNVTETQQFLRWFGDWRKNPKRASKIVNDDGTPKTVYHGINSDFTLFKSDDGTYRFSETYDYAEAMAKERGGSNVMEMYLDMKKPYTAVLEKARFADPEYEKPIIEKARAEGYDGVIFKSGAGSGEAIYAVFKPTQAKSATDNIGTFDKENPDVRYKRAYEEAGEIDFSMFSPEAEKAYKRLEKENKQLRKNLENAHMELLHREGKGIDTDATYEMAQDIKKAYGANIKTGELHREVTKLYDYMSGEKVDWDTAEDFAESIAHSVIDSCYTVKETEYTDLRDRIKSTKITIPESERADFADGYERYRKGAFGKLRLRNDGTALDVFWNSLAEEYPYFFDKEMTGARERLDTLIEIMRETAPAEQSVFETENDKLQAARELKGKILESFYKTPQGSGKKVFRFYDTRAADTMREMRRSEKAMQEQKEQLGKAMQRQEDMFENELHKAEERSEYYRSSRDRVRIMPKINSNYNYLSSMVTKPTDSRHVPEYMRGDVAKLLSMFNGKVERTGVFRTPEKATATAVKKSQLFEMYQSIMEKYTDKDNGSINSGMFKMYDADLAESLQRMRDSVPQDSEGNFVEFSRMSAAELDTVAKLLATVHHAITSENRAFSDGIKGKISDIGESVIDEMKKTREKRESKKSGSGDYKEGEFFKFVKDELNYNELSPVDFYERIGGTMLKLYNSLRDGFDKLSENRRAMNEVFQRAAEKTDVDKISYKKAEKITAATSAGSITMTRGQVMSLYALSKREQGQRHIYRGGITVADTGAKGTSSPHAIFRLTAQDVKNITSQLTKEEISVVNDVVRFLSNTCAQWGNETAMKLYGYTKFGEEWYFPIKSENSALSTFYGAKGEGNIRTQSFTKQTNKNAANPIEIGDFLTTAISHAEGMAVYNALALPQLDIERVLNYNSYEEAGDAADRQMTANVRNEIIRTYGKGAEAYIAKLHNDINGETRRSAEKSTIGDTLMNLSKKAAIGLNIRVALQQPTAIARAGMVVKTKPSDWEVKPTKELTKEMLENSPTAYWKSMGYFEIGVGRGVKDIALGKESVYEKYAMGLYGFLDDKTWTIIWGAMKNKVKRENPQLTVGSKEFFRAVDKEFRYVIDRTQVIDSVLHRTQSMRSKNSFVKAETAFMSEPLKALNLYRTELYKARRDGDNKTVAKVAFKCARNLMVTAIVTGIAQTIADVWRDDKEDEQFDENGKKVTLSEKFFTKLLGNTADNANPINMMPYLGTIYSLVSGYSQYQMEWQNLSGFISSAKGLVNNKNALPARIANFMRYGSAIAGYSYGNLYRDVSGIAQEIYRNIGGSYYASYNLKKWEININNPKNKESFMKFYEMAMENKKTDEAELILLDYMYHTKKGKKPEPSEENREVMTQQRRTGTVFDLPKDSYTEDGEEKKIPADKYADFATDVYDRNMDYGYDLIKDKRYRAAYDKKNETGGYSDEERKKALEKVEKYAYETTLAELIKGYEPKAKWINEVREGKQSLNDAIYESITNARIKKTSRDLEEDIVLDGTDEEIQEDVIANASMYRAIKKHNPNYKAAGIYKHMELYDNTLSHIYTETEYLQIRENYYEYKKSLGKEGKALRKGELMNYVESVAHTNDVRRLLFNVLPHGSAKNPY